MQENDPIGDGRTRASYEPHGIREGRVEITGPGSFTGNQAWVGLALARLAHATGDSRYLDGALRVGQWIQDNTADMLRAPYGYTGGQLEDGTSLTWKSTEHNSDVSGFFTQLAQLTGDPVWSDRAAVAADFVAAMQSADGHVDTGTGLDGSTINTRPIPLDAQTWSSLATGDPRYGAALDWTLANLIATDGPYTGPSISEVDVSKAWFEERTPRARSHAPRRPGRRRPGRDVAEQHPSGAARCPERRRQGDRRDLERRSRLGFRRPLLRQPAHGRDGLVPARGGGDNPFTLPAD